MFIIKLIKNVDYFEHLSEEVLKRIFYDLRQEYYQEGDTIFNVGDAPDKMYFISQGTVDLFIPSEYGDKIRLETLTTGSSIGSYSILSD